MRNNDLQRDALQLNRASPSTTKQPNKPKYDFTISARKLTLPTGRQSFGEPFPPRRVVLPAPSVISVIDDDASIRVATNNLLRSRGYIVHTFASAEEFLRSPHINETSCVIADVQMSAMNGLDLLAAIRAKGHDAPFIFITAFPDENLRTRAIRAGAVCFLAKPFAAPNLIKCLQTALEAGPSEAGI
jgi:CheY-like chemotaxis protein